MLLKIFFNLIIIIFGYLVGSLNTSIFVSKHKLKQDIRQVGSGNAGATNVARKSFKLGFLVWFVDWFKVVFVSLIIWSLKKYTNSPFNNVLVQLAALATLIGHVWPIFFKFKGGKGASAIFGIAISFNIIVALIMLFLFWVLVWITDYVSIASIMVSLTTIICAAIPWFSNSNLSQLFNYGYGGNWWYLNLIIFSLATIIILIKHIPNLKKIYYKQERSFRATILKNNKKKC